MGLFDFDSYFPQEDQQQLYSNNFPGQSFRDDSFASFMNPLQNMMPQTQNYFTALQNIPQRRDYQPSLGRGIGSILAGLAASFTNPDAGAEIAAAGLSAPYERAVGEYGQKLQNLGRAAQGEQGLATFAEKMAQDQFARNQFAQTQGLAERQLTQAGQLGNRGIDVQEKQLANTAAQQALERALNEKRISVEQYNAATQRLNAEANKAEGQSRTEYYKKLIGIKENPPEAGIKPSAELNNQRLKSALMSDPIVSQYVNHLGQIDIQKLNEDPDAQQQLRHIYMQLGLIPRPDVQLGK